MGSSSGLYARKQPLWLGEESGGGGGGSGTMIEDLFISQTFASGGRVKVVGVWPQETEA